jgi:hypothetical protein
MPLNDIPAVGDPPPHLDPRAEAALSQWSGRTRHWAARSLRMAVIVGNTLAVTLAIVSWWFTSGGTAVYVALCGMMCEVTVLTVLTVLLGDLRQPVSTRTWVFGFAVLAVLSLRLTAG